MPQSFKNAWRWLIGASAAAMLIASISPAANAQAITLCIARNGKIVGIDLPACKPHNIRLAWNIPGAVGDQGVQGVTGPVGVTGAVGPVGATGNIGAIGPTGPAGAVGLTGLTGSQGGVGAVGLTGPGGAQGAEGDTGSQGGVGAAGPAGPAGAVGLTGLTGSQGGVGAVGLTGPTGALGLVGLTGSQGGVGAIGPQGPMGSTGLTGPEGVQGVTGAAGPIGNTGPVGPTGPAGVTGLAGSNGANGTNGDNHTTLTGGTLGDVVGGDAGIQLTQNTSSTAPLYMAPGNGADFVQGTLQVPTPGGCATNLQVQLWATPLGIPGGPSDSAAYTFVVCDNAVCDPTAPGVSCTITGSSSSCSDNNVTLDHVAFNPGDAISIVAFNSSAGETVPLTVNVSWSLDYLYAPTSGCSGS